jgi:exosome complex component RRP4
MLSSINLPGGVQRRKLESDELQMRTYFQEGDLLVAEVQMLMSEGTMSLHTRSLKYGKLRNGTLVIVPSTLVVRLKSHFHSLQCGVDMILGMNGYIWVQAASGVKAEESNSMQEDERGEASASMAIYSSKNDDISSASRLAIDRVAACIRILAANSVTITDANVNEAYAASMEIREEGGDEIPTERLFRNDISASILAAVAALE